MTNSAVCQGEPVILEAMLGPRVAGLMLLRNIRALAKRQVTDMLAAAIQWDDPHATSTNR
jgi:hypothetical protein